MLNEVMVMFAHEAHLDSIPAWKAGLELVSHLDLILESYQNTSLAETAVWKVEALSRDPGINK